MVSISRRTSVDGDFASRNRRTASRSWSCSSEKAKFTVGLPGWYWDSVGANATGPAASTPGRPAGSRSHAAGTLSACRVPPTTRRPTCGSRSSIVGPFENNVFVVRCKGTGEAVIIDAANEHELLLEVSRATGVRRVLTTHGHWDHIQAVDGDARRRASTSGSPTTTPTMLPAYDFVIPDDDVIAVGDLRLRTIHNPGHTPGSTSFLLEGHPIALQRRHAVPRRRRQHQLPGRQLRADHRVDRPAPVHAPAPTLLVLPGHGLDTTIGTERPHLQEWVDRGW